MKTDEDIVQCNENTIVSFFSSRKKKFRLLQALHFTESMFVEDLKQLFCCILKIHETDNQIKSLSMKRPPDVGH